MLNLVQKGLQYDRITRVTSRQKPASLLLKQARMLIPRLERLSPDSSWAHRASGCRGTLLRLFQQVETHATFNQSPALDEAQDLIEMEKALTQGFNILSEAARERFL
jgi:hypothetical protein